MLFVDELKHKFFNDWFPNWSPDIALRYLPIAHDIRKTHDIRTIIDVGSGSLGITPYLKRHITGVDVTFRKPFSRYLKQVKAPGNRLPFKNKSFDASVCADTLEHIPKNLRKKIINELLRVTKKKIYITVPCENISEREDTIILEYLKLSNIWAGPYLQEHLTYGLPEEREIIMYFPPNFKIKVTGLTNIYLHRLILKFQFSNYRLGKFISSVIFVLLVPIFLKINYQPTYRRLFIIDIDNLA